MNRRFTVFVGIVCVGLLAAWFLLLWSPKGNDLTEASDRASAAELEAESLELRLARLLEAKKSSAEMARTVERLELAVPEEPTVAQFILDAHEIAAESGMDFLSITPTPPTVSAMPGVAAEVRMDIQVVGGYFRTLDYLDRLLSLSRVVVLDSVRVTPSGDGDDPTDLAVALTGRMFMSKLPGAAPADPADPADPAGSVSTPAPEERVAAASSDGSGS